MFELLRKNTEEGVVRNSKGRIVETDWPKTPHSHHKEAYKEIAESLKDQVKFEMSLRGMSKRQSLTSSYMGIYRTENTVFYTSSNLLAPELQQELAEKMQDPESPKNIRICDIGGGAGILLTANVAEYKESHLNAPKEKTLTTVLTTLIHHDARVLQEIQEMGRIDSIRTMAVELPHDDFYQFFDIIICQNSVFHWSDYPELATLNLWKMLRENGIVIANIPSSERNLNGTLFNVKDFLENSNLFKTEIVRSQTKGRALKVILRKKT